MKQEDTLESLKKSWSEKLQKALKHLDYSFKKVQRQPTNGLPNGSAPAGTLLAPATGYS